jgi:hypothetical protein
MVVSKEAIILAQFPYTDLSQHREDRQKLFSPPQMRLYALIDCALPCFHPNQTAKATVPLLT